MQIKKTILTESVTLEELRKIIREGRAAEVLAVGDQIYIDFDGAAVPYDVIGIDADTAAAEELKHTVTIQAHELIEERPFDTKGRYGSNDWETSELREYLNSEIYAARCAELAKYAIPVAKMNTNGRKTVDTFFLLSVDEYDAKDTPYEYYKDKPYRAAKHAKDDYNDWHRTRSAYRGYSYYAWYVTSSGFVSYYTANHSMRCAPACAIG
ncbi:MAG: DUF6273 domain-containing protein [Lachnospira sp.]